VAVVLCLKYQNYWLIQKINAFNLLGKHFGFQHQSSLPLFIAEKKGNETQKKDIKEEEEEEEKVEKNSAVDCILG
jgi:hypothetical protein